MSGKRRILITELWGLGDLTLATPFIREALKDSEVYLLGKPFSKELLHPSFSQLQFLYLQAPWTSHRGKYHLWRWEWKSLYSLIQRLRRLRLDVAVSVRNDPRDHFIAWISGAKERVGFGTYGSGSFLTRNLKRPGGGQRHRMEDWMQIAQALGLETWEEVPPVLRPQGYLTLRIQEVLERIHKPLFLVHMGSQIAVRRWPANYFGALIHELRKLYDFHLLLIPDPDGYGSECDWLADSTLSNLTTRELVGLLGSANLLLCNDSGPAHITAASGRPVIAIFGPGEPKWFRPWGDHHRVIIRDICPLRPCFDYCQFSEAKCLTQLTPAMALPEVVEHIESLISRGIIPGTVRKERLTDG
jgi:heptosyltransferase-2